MPQPKKVKDMDVDAFLDGGFEDMAPVSGGEDDEEEEGEGDSSEEEESSEEELQGRRLDQISYDVCTLASARKVALY